MLPVAVRTERSEEKRPTANIPQYYPEQVRLVSCSLYGIVSLSDRTILRLRRSNQLSYEATDVGSWSFVGSNGPVRNESMDHWNPQMTSSQRQWLHSSVG